MSDNEEKEIIKRMLFGLLDDEDIDSDDYIEIINDELNIINILEKDERKLSRNKRKKK